MNGDYDYDRYDSDDDYAAGVDNAMDEDYDCLLYTSLLVSVLFIPSVFIYYNDSALIHSIWYLVISSVGLLIAVSYTHLVEGIHSG